MNFVCNKHRLSESTAHLRCQRMLHIGDTPLDGYYARLAGFEFYDVADLPDSWLSLI